MNVGGAGQMQQTQMHTQMRKMDGTGGGQGVGGGQGQGGGNGMKDVMSSLSSEDKTAIQDQLKSMSSEDRAAIKDQISKLDPTSMSGDELMSSISSLINPSSQDSSESFSVYA